MNTDQFRRSVRAELHAARCRDGDHSERRLWDDARELDRRLTEAGHPPKHPTSWGTSPTIIARKTARIAAKQGGISPIASSDDSECHLAPVEAV